MQNEVNGFLRADGQKLVNGEGQEVLLRGVGFGSWMLPEGYMWRFPAGGDRPRRIERMIVELVGEAKADEFWDLYYDRYVTEADIQQIAADGYNSVRVPIHYRFLLEEGSPVRCKEKRLKLIDEVIAWCRTHRLYVVLDLHGAPGGQTGANIDDSEHDQPELFMKEEHQQATIELWRILADRYKDEWIVAGYDLLNEPLPEWFSQYNPLVMPLYRDIIAAIREVDDRHMIILEGAHWATDWSIFDVPPDDNLMLQFHKYWNNPDTESIQKFLDKQQEWQVPIYMGEGGENNINWYAGAFQLYEDHNISWNFWTWKKMDTDNSPFSIDKPEGWHLLVAYLEGGAKPDPETAERILWTYLDHMKIENCKAYPEVTRSLLRRAPVRIPAIFYGYKGPGISYKVNHPVNRSQANDLDMQDKEMRRCLGFRENDGTDIRFITGQRTTANFQHGGGEPWQDDEKMCVQLEVDDWLAYDFTTGPDSEASSFFFLIRAFGVGSPDPAIGKLQVDLDGKHLNPISIITEQWAVYRVSDERSAVSLSPGSHRLVVTAKGCPIRIEWLEIKCSKP
ncbi:glycoside hydrolase family 5 protein [Marinicrinis sediminis]|uniref:Glycoside hydrolase family 5 protein n=1 Tax=Marinicrinis sediminis TaxID=1652465 RepID=A0ABW5R927_9BACL